MRYRFLDNAGRRIAHNLTDDCGYCFACEDGSTIKRKCPVDGTVRRLGSIKTTLGEVSLCSPLRDHIKSRSFFQSQINAFASTLASVVPARDALAEAVGKTERRLLHNLTSLNAHCIQELYALVPQEVLTKDIHQQFAIIREIISSDLQKAAKTILRIAKHNLAMKSEFAAMRYLDGTSTIPSPKVKSHPIRKVVLNVLHAFFPDFNDIGVRVIVEECDENVQLDYDTFHVAVYHIIDNATKYIRADSDLTVSFEDKVSSIHVVFDMQSLPIPAHERRRIGEEGFSGELARSLDLAGHGLGMFRTKRLIALNGGKLIVKPNVMPSRTVSLNGIDYEENQFILTLQKPPKAGRF
jgi:signal transduction histidine kinase